MVDQKITRKSETMRSFGVLVREATLEANDKPAIKRNVNRIGEKSGVTRKKREKVG
jgi:hypothetical protein